MKTKKIDLLDGNFSSEEVKEVINNLCNGQMEFYKLRYLQDIEQKEQAQQTAQEMESLREKKMALKNYLEAMNNNSSSVKVCLEITHS